MTMAEEIDDDSVVDNWEDFEENPDVLDQQLKKMSMKNVKQYNNIGETVIINEGDGQRSNPFSSQEPKIMILRRPKHSTEEMPNGIISSQKQKQPVKTLQQRQAEYAEARLRILGNSGSSGSSPEDPKVKLLQQKPLDQRNSDSFSPGQIYSTSSINISEDTSSSLACSGNSTKPIALVKPSQSSVNVIRTPRGPSSQIGFRDRVGNNGPS